MKKILFFILIFISPSVGAEEGYPEFVSNFGGNYNGYPKLPIQYYDLIKDACFKYYKNDVPEFPCMENAVAQMSVENTRYLHNLISPTSDYGLVQINRPSYPYITIEQAFDPNFSIDWMIRGMGERGAQTISFSRALCRYNTGSYYYSCSYSNKVLARRKAIFNI